MSPNDSPSVHSLAHSQLLAHSPHLNMYPNQRSVIVALPHPVGVPAHILNNHSTSAFERYSISPSSSPVDLSSSQSSHLLGHPRQPYPHLSITPPSDMSDSIYSSPYGDYSKLKRKPLPVPSESKDDAYWERRKRNNESAKRSREIRKRKEMQTSHKIQFLEQENVKLQTEVSFLREEIKRLRDVDMLPYLLHKSS